MTEMKHYYLRLLGIQLIVFFALLFVAVAVMEVYLRYTAATHSETMSTNQHIGWPQRVYPHLLFEPNHEILHEKFIDGIKIFAATYNIGESGNRLVPPLRSDAKKHLVFFGCSYTFGHGMNDNETTPFYVAEQFPNYQAYNFSVPGGSMANTYMILKDEKVKQAVSQTEGIAVYILYGNLHTNRTLGFLRSIDYGWSNPYLTISEDDSGLKFNGSFEKAFPFAAGATQFLLKHSRVAGQLIYALKPTNSKKDFDFAFRVVQEAQKLYLEQFPKGRFIVVSASDSQLTPHLQSKGFEIIDISQLKIETEDYLSPYDRHYSAIGNKKIGDLVVAGLKELNIR